MLKECQQSGVLTSRLPYPLGIWDKVNSDVELGVATLDEVPYALGLIGQSLEQQLDNDEGTN